MNSSPDLPLSSLYVFRVSSCQNLCRGTDETDSGKPPLVALVCQPRQHTLFSLPVCILPSRGIPSSRRQCSALASDYACHRLPCTTTETHWLTTVTDGGHKCDISCHGQLHFCGWFVEGRFCIASHIQGGPKKLHTKLMAITLSILNRFSQFFHCWKAK